jgi:arylsulfatase A-like enzyme
LRDQVERFLCPIRRRSFAVIFAPMPANILVVVVDGLRASALGAYGNTTFSTPSLDQFAAESLLFDWCYAGSPELSEIYRALWYSVSRADEPARGSPSLPGLFDEHGYATLLFSGEPELNGLAAEVGFGDIHCCADQLQSRNSKATDLSETALSIFFATAADKIREQSAASKPQFVWLHTRGMYGPWDAPLDLQEALLDETDPPPIASVTPPDFHTNAGDDPDAVFRYSCAYAAQIMAFDACWAEFITPMLASSPDEWLVIFMGARGFPLGEHQRVGGVDSRLYADQLHVPWLIRFPDGLAGLARVNGLTSHVDVLPTIAEWLNPGAKLESKAFEGLSALQFASGSTRSWRSALCSKSTTSHAIRTESWCLREDVDASKSSPELYVRPDDRWEANDVAKLLPDTVEELRSMRISREARC